MGTIRIKQEPVDSGEYGINPVPPIDRTEISVRIKTEPGIDVAIKQEKDVDFSGNDLLGAVKTEPSELVNPSVIYDCAWCPVHAGKCVEHQHLIKHSELDPAEHNQHTSNAERETNRDSQETATDPSNILEATGEDVNTGTPKVTTASDVNIDETVTNSGEGRPNITANNTTSQTDSILATTVDEENFNETGSVLAQTHDLMDDRVVLDTALHNGANRDKFQNTVANAGQDNGMVTSAGETSEIQVTVTISNSDTPMPSVEPDGVEVKQDEGKDSLKVQSGSLAEDESGSKGMQLDDILSEAVNQIYSEINEQKDAEKDKETFDLDAKEEDRQEEGTETLLRHSVEDRRQETIEFLKELNRLQTGDEQQHDKSSEFMSDTFAMKSSRKSTEIQRQLSRKSVDLDRILTETVDRIYSEVQSETGSTTGSVSNDQVECVGGETENLKSAGEPTKGEIEKIESNSEEAVIQKPEINSNELKETEESLGTCEIRPIVIEPGDYSDENEEGGTVKSGAVSEEMIKTEPVGGVRESLDATPNVNDVLSTDLETAAIKIEPMDCETLQETENSSYQNGADATVIKTETESSPTLNGRPSKSDKENVNDENAAPCLTETTNTVDALPKYIGSCTIEGNVGSNALKTLVRTFRTCFRQN